MLTEDPIYWKPTKPRINFYDLDDKTDTTTRFTYDGFPGTGAGNKVIKLGFESSTTNVGQCFVTIEDSDNDFVSDSYLMKGCRIKIELSKDNVNWVTAFRGLVRANETEAFGVNGRNITFTGYNYLIRLNERITKINRESTKTGASYNRTDTNMFTNNLVESMISSGSSYIFSDDDFSVLGYDMAQYGSISDSPVTTWIPKLDVEYSTLASAIDEVLEYSGSLITIDHATTNLTLYDPNDFVTGMNIFIITNGVNKLADDAAYTMYPLENARYRIGWDTEESANRLIFPFKHPSSHLREAYPEWDEDRIEASVGTGSFAFQQSASVNRRWAQLVEFDAVGSPGVLRAVLQTEGNCSGLSKSSTKCQIATASATPGMGTVFGGPYTMWPQNTADGTFPDDSSIPYPSSATNFFVVGMRDEDNIAQVVTGKLYWFIIYNEDVDITNNMGIVPDPYQSTPANNNSQWLVTYSDNAGSTWPSVTSTSRFRIWNIPQHQKGEAELNLDWIVIGRDATTVKGTGGWFGNIERTITSAPQHIDTLQTIQEYLFPRLYYASKPKILFDYPSLTMPNTVPKAGDIVCHYDTQLGTGTRNQPIQTGVISDIQYSFDQDADGVLGLRKLSLSTSGIRRGQY